MIFKSVNHIAIIVSNLEVSRNFYIHKLGFRLIHELDRPERKSTIVYLDAGNCILELFSFPDPPERQAWPEACGLRHLAFTVENFDSAIERLNNMNIATEPVRTDARTGKKMTFFKDPDNLPLEVCEA
ncbi:MAG TPA: VOC family protein [Chitinophagaceae bacterium]|nr:VOC family protein [Chitinophagaceae bacterium]